VLHVLPRLNRDETVQDVVDLTRMIGRQGWRTVVASSGGPLAREVHAAGAVVEPMPLGDRGPLARWRGVRGLAAAGKRHGVALMHVHEPSSMEVAAAAARRLGVGLVTTIHQIEQAAAPGRCHKSRRGKSMLSGDRIIAVSEHLAEQVRAMPDAERGRLRTIPPGIDLAELDPERVRGHRVAALAERWNIGAETRILLLPGPLAEGYGQHLLLEAVARLGRDDLLVLLLGPEQPGSSYLQRLQDTMRRLAIAQRVRFAQDCTDVPAAMQLADLIALPATRPLPAARMVVAAQAMGKPVIVSNVGALPELVMPAMTGWLVPAGDVAELAWAIERALSLEPEVKDRLAQRARAFVRAGFDLERTAARTLSLYRELLGPGVEDAVAGSGLGPVQPAAH
jgi:glycosyltransferase involved in cell wall biosynthesis